jgi:hypothetical protein
VVTVGHAGLANPFHMNCIKGANMKIGSIGFFHGEIVRVLQIGQTALIIEVLDNPRINPFAVNPADFALFWP